MSQNNSLVLAVFCGAKSGKNSEYLEIASQLAEAFIQNKITMLYGAGTFGLMGQLADIMVAHQGQIIGIITEHLRHQEGIHPGLTRLEIVDTMHERKKLINKYADGFIALPGGIGSADELLHMFSLSELGFHNKPCAILNTNNYYEQFIVFLDHMVKKGFLSRQHRETLIISNSVDDLITKCLERININKKGKKPISKNFLPTGC